jgi:Family of unknown function (DUF6011)
MTAAAAIADARLLGRLGDVLDAALPTPPDLIEGARALFRLAGLDGGELPVVTCRDCDRPLTDPASRARRRGSKCQRDHLARMRVSTVGLRADHGECSDQLTLEGAP